MKLLFVLGILVGTLALFNPTEADFRAFVQERMTDTISDVGRAAGGSFLGVVAGEIGGRLASTLAAETVERDNYFAFSIYTVDLDGPDRGDEEWKFLGVARQFIPLKKPASLRDRAGV